MTPYLHPNHKIPHLNQSIYQDCFEQRQYLSLVGQPQMVEYFKFQVGSCGVKSWDGCLCDIMWASLDVSIKLGSKIESNSFILATILKMGGSAQGVSLGCIFYRKRERQNLTYILRSSFFFCLKIVVTLGTTIQNTPSKNPINTQFHKRY